MYGVNVATIYLEKLKYQLFPIRRIFGAGGEAPRCDCLDETCPNAGKHPRIPWSKELGTPSMWERWPDDGFGIATGDRSSLWVLDVDPRSGGVETLSALEQKNTPLPRTISVKTGSGGLHFYFQYPGPDFRNTAGALGAGLDTRGDGGYVVGPGSLHKNGKRYFWQNGPADTALAPAPEWLLALVKTPPRKIWAGGGEEKAGLHLAPVPRAEVVFLLAEMVSPANPVIAWMLEYPDSVDRETWRGVATNLACACLGYPDLLIKAEEAFHALSARYDNYKPRETANVFRDSISVAMTYGPMSFNHMTRCGMPAELVFPPDAKNLLHAARMAWNSRRPRPTR